MNNHDELKDFRDANGIFESFGVDLGCLFSEEDKEKLLVEVFMVLDSNKLRNDLMDYYGTAMAGPFPMAVIDLGELERASDKEMLDMAKKVGFDLRKYEIR